MIVEVGFDIGVVGGLQVPAGGEVVMAEIGSAGDRASVRASASAARRIACARWAETIFVL